MRRPLSWQRSGVVLQRLWLRRLIFVKRLPKLRFEPVSFLFLACFSNSDEQLHLHELDQMTRKCHSMWYQIWEKRSHKVQKSSRRRFAVKPAKHRLLHFACHRSKSEIKTLSFSCRGVVFEIFNLRLHYLYCNFSQLETSSRVSAPIEMVFRKTSHTLTFEFLI